MVYHNSKCIMFAFLCLLVCVSITIQNLGRRFPSAETTSTEISAGKSLGEIDYNAVMKKISHYRLHTYPKNRTYKWLFLSSLHVYRVMMDRHYFAQYYAAKRHPHIDAVLWGRDFPGYNTSQTIIENIRHYYGISTYFDVIYQSGGIYPYIDLRNASQYSPIMAREHECWGYRCLPWIIDSNTSIHLQTFAYEIDLYHTSFSYNRVFAHSPTSAEPLVFYPPVALKNKSLSTRDIDLLVVGARHPFVYPLRTRLGEMVKKGLIKNSYLHTHPGYNLGNNTVEQTEAQVYAYAALLRRAKIVIVDSARYGHAFSKYMEVSLSGCLIIGDIPAEREEEFRQFIVEISMNMTDTEILSIIDYWVKNGNEREIRAAVGQRITLNKYTWDHSIDLSLQALIRYQRREYGIYHNYPYSTRCFPFDNTDPQEPIRSKWCTYGIKGIPLRSPCLCNQTGINYMNDEQDLDGWQRLGENANVTNPLLYLVPTTFLLYCDSYTIIEKFVHQSSSGSLCHCQHADGPWRGSNICYVSNTALTISRYLVYLDKHRRRNVK